MSDLVGTSIQQMALRKGKELEIHWGVMKTQGWFNTIQEKQGNQVEMNLNILIEFSET